MAAVKYQHREDDQTLSTCEFLREVELALEPADFELDERLRTLRLDEWFATVKDDMPLWVC